MTLDTIQQLPASEAVEENRGEKIAYCCGLAAIVLAGFLTKALGAMAYTWGLMLAGAGAFTVGFVMWARPLVLQVWQTSWGKTAFAGLNLIMLWLSAVLARGMVADALGLPPQDFELTLSALTFFLYVPTSIAIATALLGVGSIILYSGALLVAPFREKWFLWLLGRTVGSFALVIWLAMLNGWLMDHERSAHGFVRWIASVADYFPARAYPGVGEQRVRLHENGVISSAKVVNGELQIVVRKIEP